MVDKIIDLGNSRLNVLDLPENYSKLIEKIKEIKKGSYLTAEWFIDGKKEYHSGFLQSEDEFSMQLRENKKDAFYLLDNLIGIYIWDF